MAQGMWGMLRPRVVRQTSKSETRRLGKRTYIHMRLDELTHSSTQERHRVRTGSSETGQEDTNWGIGNGMLGRTACMVQIPLLYRRTVPTDRSDMSSRDA